MKRTVLALLVLALGSLGCGDDSSPAAAPHAHAVTLFENPLSLLGETFYSVQVNVAADMQQPRVAGSFIVLGGGGPTLELLVLTEAAFDLWIAGNTVTAVHASGQVASAEFSVALTPGVYYAVFDNTFAVEDKNAVARVALEWSR